MVSEISERSDCLGQVAVEVGHTGREEGVHHRAGQEAPQVRLEETHDQGFVGLPERTKRRTELDSGRRLDGFRGEETHPGTGEQMQPQGWLRPLT